MRYLLGVILVATGILACPISLLILGESLAGKAKSNDLIAGGCFLFGGIAMFFIGMRLVRAAEAKEQKSNRGKKPSKENLEVKPDEYLTPQDKFATFDLSRLSTAGWLLLLGSFFVPVAAAGWIVYASDIPANNNRPLRLIGAAAFVASLGCYWLFKRLLGGLGISIFREVKE